MVPSGNVAILSRDEASHGLTKPNQTLEAFTVTLSFSFIFDIACSKMLAMPDGFIIGQVTGFQTILVEKTIDLVHHFSIIRRESY